METVKGKKTVLAVALTALIGVLTSTETSELITNLIEEYPGEWTIFLSAVFGVLRAATTTPVFKKYVK